MSARTNENGGFAGRHFENSENNVDCPDYSANAQIVLESSPKSAIPPRACLWVGSSRESMLDVFTAIAARIYKVEVFKSEAEGIVELHARRVGDTRPAGFKIQLLEPEKVLNSEGSLNEIFQILIDNVLAYKGNGAQGNWQCMPALDGCTS